MKQQQGALLKHRLLHVDCVIRLRPGTFDAHIITKCLGLFYLVLAISNASQCNAPKERTFRTCNEIIAQHTKSLFVRRCLHIECMGIACVCVRFERANVDRFTLLWLMLWWPVCVSIGFCCHFEQLVPCTFTGLTSSSINLNKHVVAWEQERHSPKFIRRTIGKTN